jgi:hypothetical protein
MIPLHELQKKNRELLISWSVLVLWLVILGWHLFIPTPDDYEPIFWVDVLPLFLLYGYVHITSLGLGRILSRRFSTLLSETELLLLAYMLGLGGLSMIIALVGFLGWLHPLGIFIGLALSGFVSSSEWGGIIRSVLSGIRGFRFPRAAGFYEVLLRTLIVLTVPILLVHLLTPVWDYDALLYHLEVPSRFILHEHIYFDQGMMRSAYPFLGEMLFLVGIIFRLDSLSKLIHLTHSVLFVSSVYVFGKRFFSRETSLIAVGILVSAPSFLLWSTWASIDFAWAGYEFWSMYAVFLWLTSEKTETKKWLILAGAMSGLAASTKYISIPSLLVVAVLILWASRYQLQQTIAKTVQNLFIFGMVAGLVMGAWYIKNWVITGNPIYPLVFGGPGWDPLENIVLNDYVRTFGIEKNLVGFLTLPYFVYASQSRFSTISLEVIHPLLWLGFLFPFLVRSKKYTAIVAYVVVYYIWWFFGSQVIRFLLPLSAFLALFAGDVIERFPVIIKNGLNAVLIIGLMVFNFSYHVLALHNSGSFAYVAGQKNKADFLHVFVDDLRVKEYIQESLHPDERVQFLWDGRGYYCDSRCVADTEQSAAVILTTDSPKPEKLAQDFRDNGISYLMLSKSDANFFIASHDPNGYHRDAWDYFNNIFLPVCGRSVLRDGGMELYELVC